MMDRRTSILNRAMDFAKKVHGCEVRGDVAERARTREAWADFLESDAFENREEAIQAYYDELNKLEGRS